MHYEYIEERTVVAMLFNDDPFTFFFKFFLLHIDTHMHVIVGNKSKYISFKITIYDRSKVLSFMRRSKGK